MMAHERITGEVHDFMESAPVLPTGLVPLWNDFIGLHNSRGSGMAGPARITFADLDAWQRVTGSRLQAWEIAAIHKADNAYLAQAAKAVAK
jgi:hypothetical protein